MRNWAAQLPCDWGGCFIECACPLCQDDSSEISLEQLFDHHNRYHHAPHLKCAFCRNFLNCFPVFRYISYAKTNCLPLNPLTLLPSKVYDPFPTYEFKHVNRSEKESLDERLKCEDCDLSFSKASAKFRHIQVVHDKKRFKCKQCKEKFSRRDRLIRHIKKHS